ncbi:hypothetical protein GCM10011583_07370 [Streptomyces camponoticapitis]|uniref:Uncharacterized protein n=1 Tax=Streptomyces camponoticapitis TaxID=1616125 RepID=A0ABQ2DZ55_9ACTN|nr:hypothetical protein GCM10011583_07370 [Streptomyces camponoticapitis]
MVKTKEAAGVAAGNASTWSVVDMAGNVGELISSVNKKSRNPAKLKLIMPSHEKSLWEQGT